jgi:hypothetical protein
MNLKNTIEYIWAKADKYVVKPKAIGGQQCGIPPMPFCVEELEIGISITVGYHNSVHKNKDLAETLFKLAVEEIIK